MYYIQMKYPRTPQTKAVTEVWFKSAVFIAGFTIWTTITSYMTRRRRPLRVPQITAAIEETKGIKYTKASSSEHQRSISEHLILHCLAFTSLTSHHIPPTYGVPSEHHNHYKSY
jgi:hypothetical protein